MNLRKDDPVYYKSKIIKLIKEARENGLEVYASKPYACYNAPIEINFEDSNGEIAAVQIKMN